MMQNTTGHSPPIVKMEYMYSTTKEFVLNTSLEVRIKDFCSATEVVSTFMEDKYTYEDFHVFVFASVFPDGVDEDTKGWLVILPDAKFLFSLFLSEGGLLMPNNGFLSAIVSIIDIKGNSRLPQYYEKLPSDKGPGNAKYFKKSFILNNSNEFLNEGVLTLRFDIEFAWSGIETYSARVSYGLVKKLSLNKFFLSIPHEVFKDSSETENNFTVYDLTGKISNLPLFYDLIKDCGICPKLDSLNSPCQSKESRTEIMESTWILDTDPDKFLLSFEENVGTKLIKYSPVIRNCVNYPMREHTDKLIDFSHVSSQTFKIVLYNLENGLLPDCKFNDILSVYEFSHMYMMKELQKECAECLVRLSRFQSYLILIRNIADLYSDEYFKSLLTPSNMEYENSTLVSRQLNKEDQYDNNEAKTAWL